MKKRIWISANNPPNKDMQCYIVCNRLDGSVYMPNYSGTYTTGLQRGEHLLKGFLNERVVAWMHIPESYTKNKNGWLLINDGYSDDKYPTKRGEYIVSTFDRQNRERVIIAFFEPDKLIFYGQPDAIAWMPIPKWEVE